MNKMLFYFLLIGTDTNFTNRGEHRGNVKYIDSSVNERSFTAYKHPIDIFHSLSK